MCVSEIDKYLNVTFQLGLQEQSTKNTETNTNSPLNLNPTKYTAKELSERKSSIDTLTQILSEFNLNYNNLYYFDEESKKIFIIFEVMFIHKENLTIYNGKIVKVVDVNNIKTPSYYYIDIPVEVRNNLKHPLISVLGGSRKHNKNTKKLIHKKLKTKLKYNNSKNRKTKHYKLKYN